MAEPDKPAEPAPRPQLQLKSQKFREAREGDWKALSKAIDKVESRGLGAFSVEDILNLPVLYRTAVSSLSMAQSISLDRNLITYLQALCARAYVNMYGPHTRLKDVAGSFFGGSWPRAIRALLPEIVLAALLITAGVVAGWLFCAHDHSWYNLLVGGMAEGRDLSSSTDDLRKTLGHAEENAFLPPMAAFLMTHNTQVSIMAFALGAVFGLPTLYFMVLNGVGLGAMLWLFADRGLGFEFAAWLTIHGTTELFAIAIAGGCGFHIARRLLFPGDETRLKSLKAAGELTGTAMIGVGAMLIVAGCLEGIGRQTITDPWARIAIGGVMLALWLAYYGLAGRREAARG